MLRWRRVATATALVRERAPDLLLEGPIQYDAAIDPEVARISCPDSPVAGRATVFIFPDLNTGNNTVQGGAAQRPPSPSARCCKGYRKPVNDLSRGALVSDIVNTVAITAVQGQAIKQPQPAEAAAAGRPYDRSACAGFERRLLVAEVSTGGAETAEVQAKGLIERIEDRVALSLIMTRLCGRCKIELQLRALILKPQVCGLSVIG